MTKAAEKELRKRLNGYRPGGIHFLDSGNYHYMTRLFVEKIHEPFSLVLFDHHSDMQQPVIHELTSCGSWAADVLRTNRYIRQLILVGPERPGIGEIGSEFQSKLVCITMQALQKHQVLEEFAKIRQDLPAYISVDKDVLDRYDARTNWNQGNMSVDMLEKLLGEVFSHQQVIGIDICGECSMSEPFSKLLEDEKINAATNKSLYEFLLAKM